MQNNKTKHFIEELSERDIFIDYDYESVMFRWDHVNKKAYKKFYGQQENDEVIDHSNRLYNDALRFGDEISEVAYLKGKDNDV